MWSYLSLNLVHSVDYTSFACEIQLILVVPKRKLAGAHYNLAKPFTSITWGAIIVTVGLVLLVSFNVTQKPSVQYEPRKVFLKHFSPTFILFPRFQFYLIPAEMSAITAEIHCSSIMHSFNVYN